MGKGYAFIPTLKGWGLPASPSPLPELKKATIGSLSKPYIAQRQVGAKIRVRIEQREKQIELLKNKLGKLPWVE